jgi:hypothetical protein
VVHAYAGGFAGIKAFKGFAKLVGTAALPAKM